MLRKRYLITLLVVLSMLVTSFGGMVGATENFSHNIPRDEVLEKLQGYSDKVDIHTIGSLNIQFNDSLANNKQITQLKDFVGSENNNRMNTVWISKEETKNVLKNISEVKRMLSKGVSFYFIGLEDSNLISKTFVSDKYKKESLDGPPDYQFITQNKNGEYFVGLGYFHDLTKEQKFETLLASSWNRRNDLTYTGPATQEKIDNSLREKLGSAIKISKAFAGGESYDLGASWTPKSGWTNVEHSSGNGNLEEWYRLLYFNDGYDDYYAIASEFHLSPLGGGWADKLIVQADADMYQSTNELFKYAPYTSPSSSTFSFNINAGTSGTSVGASWSITLNELEYDTIGTDTVTAEAFKGTFDYQGRSDYAEGGHVQDSSVIIQRDSGTQGEFYQTYTAYFTDFLTTSCGGSYHITIYE
ncbi:MAG: hypothetical protein RO469_05100 [Thermincola sp.]|jgi:hypothetical protein|nr:hypothetical protein [Thermincola sp.]MDT3702135.1 hypothetical protein [Thermincola sp.]